MRAELFYVAGTPTGRLAVMPRPRAGDWLADEIASWKAQGLDVVVSLLEEHEVVELGLGDERAECAKVGMQFISFPVPDRGFPASAAAVNELVAVVAANLRAGRGVGIHCRFGIGRSATPVVCVLCSLGVGVDDAWREVQIARGTAVPDTPQQREWAARWAGGNGGGNA